MFNENLVHPKISVVPETERAPLAKERESEMRQMEGGEQLDVDQVDAKVPNSGRLANYTTQKLMDVSKNVCQRAHNPVKLTFTNINQHVEVESKD